MPLDVPLNTEGEGLVDLLVAQAKDVIEVAYRPLVDAAQPT